MIETLSEWQADCFIEFPREGPGAIDDWTYCMLKRREKRILILIDLIRKKDAAMKDMIAACEMGYARDIEPMREALALTEKLGEK